MRSPVPTSSRKATRIRVPPSRPSSSPITVKMKSVSTAGKRSKRPSPGPVPVTPPRARPNWLRQICWPSAKQRSQGSSQMSTRCWTWVKVFHAKYAPLANNVKPTTR